MKSLIRVLHRIYKICISSLLGNTCRFYPSCSDYALEAIELHGLTKGSYLGLKRICKCHPWCEGYFDPVPQKNHKTSEVILNGR